MDYFKNSDSEVVFRFKIKGGWNSFYFIPTNQSLIIRQTYPGGVVYKFPTINEMYRNTLQISYPKAE
jgi:hypothetical protein